MQAQLSTATTKALQNSLFYTSWQKESWSPAMLQAPDQPGGTCSGSQPGDARRNAGSFVPGSLLPATRGAPTLPGWAASPAWVPGRCRCPGSSSSPAPGIWKWFVEAPGRKGDIHHHPHIGETGLWHFPKIWFLTDFLLRDAVFMAIREYQALTRHSLSPKRATSTSALLPPGNSLKAEHTRAHLTKPRNGTFKVKFRTKCISEAMVEVLVSSSDMTHTSREQVLAGGQTRGPNGAT